MRKLGQSGTDKTYIHTQPEKKTVNQAIKFLTLATQTTTGRHRFSLLEHGFWPNTHPTYTSIAAPAAYLLCTVRAGAMVRGQTGGDQSESGDHTFAKLQAPAGDDPDTP